MLTTFVTLLVFLSSLLLWWLRKKFTFWNDKGVKHLTFWEYLRFCIDIYTKPLNGVIAENYARYGRLYGTYLGTAPTLVVGDPEILRDVMVSKFRNFSDRTEAQRASTGLWRKSIMNLSGDEWKRARSIFTPALTASRLRTIALKVNAIAERTTSQLLEAAAQDQPVNFTKLVEHASLNTTAVLNYSVDLDSDQGTGQTVMNSIAALFSTVAGWKGVMIFMMPGIYKALKPEYPPKASADLFKAFVSHLMEERKSKNKKEDDFLQVFMDADYSWESDGDKNVEVSESKKMSLEEIVAQGIVFFLAGVETVSATLLFTAYCLALHPELQEKAIAEVDKATQKGPVTYDALQEMPYIEACIKEALRLRSSESFTMRLCTEETTVAGITFKPGMCVKIPLVAIHRDPEFFPEPEKYDPERFMPENKDSIRPFTYMPFGAGPRNCVGMRLGMLQVKTFLACLLQRVKLERCSDTMVPLKYKPRQLLPVTDGPVILKPVARGTAAS